MASILTSCSSDETNLGSTASMIEVINKQFSEDYSEAWIVAFDPNGDTKEEPLRIFIEEPMVWNLIEEGKTYFASYKQEDSETWILQQINHEDDEDALR